MFSSIARERIADESLRYLADIISPHSEYINCLLGKDELLCHSRLSSSLYRMQGGTCFWANFFVLAVYNASLPSQ